MSRRIRYRVTAMVLGGLLLGVPLLTNGTASAGQAGAADSRAGHDRGGLHGFCDGAPVSLDPDCALDDRTAPALVPDIPAEPMLLPLPVPDPFRTLPDARPGPGDPTPDLTTDGVLAASPDVSTSGPDRPATQPARVVKQQSIKVRPAKPRAAAPATARRPDHSGSSRRHQMSAGAGAQMHARTLPDVDRKPALRVPKRAVTPRATVPVPAAVVVPPSPVAALEPGLAPGPLPREQPIGLLALVASVCALGVGLGAIRAFVSQRAYRTRFA